VHVRPELFKAGNIKLTVLRHVTPCSLVDVEGDSGGELSILGGNSIGHCERKKFI
jgi:hypothetical protein